MNLTELHWRCPTRIIFKHFFSSLKLKYFVSLLVSQQILHQFQRTPQRQQTSLLREGEHIVLITFEV